jgi:hypothetical protein
MHFLGAGHRFFNQSVTKIGGLNNTAQAKEIWQAVSSTCWMALDYTTKQNIRLLNFFNQIINRRGLNMSSSLGRDNTRQRAMVSIAAVSVTLLVLLLLTMCQGSTPNEAAQLYQTAPTLYDQKTGEAIPASQQWLVPLDGAQSALVQEDALSGNGGWLSPDIDYKSNNKRLNMLVDYAGKESYGSGTSEIYSALACMDTGCVIQPSSGSYATAATSRIDSLSSDRTMYEPNHPGNSSLFYGYTPNTSYILESTPAVLALRINTVLAAKHELAWMRVSIHHHPIGLKKLNFFLTAKYQLFFKCLLLLIPLLMWYDYRRHGGFHSKQALVTGGLLMLLGVIHTVLWDINYMVISCLLFALTGMFYTLANHIYKLVFGLGYFILVVFAYQYYAGFNKGFVMQTAFIGLIGIGLIAKQPE